MSKIHRSKQEVVDLIGQPRVYIENLRNSGLGMSEILASLTAIAESLSGPGTTASILLLNEEGLLRNGASPNLPDDYLRAIDRLKPQADLGTSASAAATGEVVITSSFYDDSKWAELRHLPLSLGYVAAWSMPIKDARGVVIGTFGAYFRVSRGPSLDERDGMKLLVEAAAAALRTS